MECKAEARQSPSKSYPCPPFEAPGRPIWADNNNNNNNDTSISQEAIIAITVIIIVNIDLS